MIYDPIFSTYGVEDLVFHLSLMNGEFGAFFLCFNTLLTGTQVVSVLVDDFSGPAESTNFPLGSMIPILASVEQETHQPLLLLLEECVATTTSDLRPGSDLYPIITNKGYLYVFAQVVPVTLTLH